MNNPLTAFQPAHQGALSMFNMAPQNHAGIAGPKTPAIGIKGPWHLNPGNPMFPNHRPFLTNPKPPNAGAPTPPQQFKMT